jgi:hypothetical protein
MTSRELVTLPIWKGQRILDKTHSDSIKAAVGSNVKYLDSGYSIVKYKEENADGNTVTSSYLIDGQHRAHILRTHFSENLCEPDFQVLVIETRVESESEAIDCFNALNNVKPMHWDHDPKIMTNKYVDALCKAFNFDKKNQNIRQGTTKRPYLSVDNLRTALEQNVSLLKQSNEFIDRFVERVVLWNARTLAEFRVHVLDTGNKHQALMEGAEKKGLPLPTIPNCLGSRSV